MLFVYLFLFCVALSSSTSSEAEDLSSAFKGADDIFSAFWGAEELKFWLKMVCLSLPSAWYCWMHWYKKTLSGSGLKWWKLKIKIKQQSRYLNKSLYNMYIISNDVYLGEQDIWNLALITMKIWIMLCLKMLYKLQMQ